METHNSTPAVCQRKSLLSGKQVLRKSLLPLGLTLFFSFSLNAQVAIQRQKCLGGTGDEWGDSMQQTADGGCVVAGSTISNDGDASGNHGWYDFWVVKLDGSGNLQWQKCLGGTGIEIAYSIQQTTDGGYVVAGYTHSNDGDVSGNHGDHDCWVVKLDGSGNLQWQKCLGGLSSDVTTSIQQTADGGYVAAGLTYSNDGDVSGNHGDRDSWVVKLDASGNIQWQKGLGGTINDEASSIQQTTDGGYVVAGQTRSNDGDVSGNHGGDDYWVVKLDGSGNIQWQKCLGGTATDFAQAIQQTTDGGYVMAGGTDSNDGDVSGNHGGYDYWVVKLDGTGNIQWQECLGGTGYDYANSIQQTADGGYVATGYTYSNDGDVSGNHGIIDYWVVKLDGSGNIQWQKCLGGTSNDEASSIQQTADGGYVVAGFTNSNDGNVSGNHGDYDFWVVKITEHYNLITGNLFYDANSNNIQDAGEPSLPNRKVNEFSTGRFGFSGINGTYYVAVLDSGNYTVLPEAMNNFTASPLTHSAYFSSIQQTDSLNDFALQPTTLFNDLCVTITPVGNFRAGMHSSYTINYSNAGTTIINNCSIIFLPDGDLTYVSSNTTPASVFPDSVIWNIGTLAPFQTGSITVTVSVNVGTPIGTQIVSGARIDPVAGDANPACNYSYWEVTTTGPVDPNDILVNRATLFTTEFPNPPFLEYIIRFQNVGNDTAFTVRIFNPIDTSKLDIHTLDFVASSHPVNMNYKFHERTMEFKFENILLPDSTTNEPMSHGFVRYKIKPRQNLVLNDTIPNHALIHFDFENPVITNTAITTVVLPTGTSPLSLGEGSGVRCFPNPATDEITITFGNSKHTTERSIKLRLYDLTGRVMMEKPIAASEKHTTTLSLASLNNGLYIVELEINGEKQRARFVKGK